MEIQNILARLVRINMPKIVSQAWAFVTDQIWPVIVDVLAQPLLWLAVAALVFGWCSRLRSCGARVSRTARIPGATAFARYSDKRAFRRIGARARRVVCATGRVSRTRGFLGDIDDKYLPALHSLRRLVLRRGPDLSRLLRLRVQPGDRCAELPRETAASDRRRGMRVSSGCGGSRCSSLVQDALVELGRPLRPPGREHSSRRRLEIFVQRSTGRPAAPARPESTQPVLAGAEAGT